MYRAGTDIDVVCRVQVDIAGGVQLAAKQGFIIEIHRAATAFTRRFTGDMQAVSGGTQANILRLYINSIGINISADGSQIVNVGGQCATDIHFTAQMADMLTGRAAAAIICRYLVAGLPRIEQPVAASIDL
ncbi:Uncharacterised protein [Yersinia frederiksenii]|nr:Uncharacterised protein [Yersinia frederiksenii]